MTDAKAPLPQVSSGAPHHNASDKDKTDPDKPAAVARAANKPTSNTPARPSSALKTRQANSNPRVRSRRAPARSLSTPLARSLSVRVSSKDRRWSERQTDPKSPNSTTYKDDFQPPENLSYKLRSLNLETSLGTSSAGNDGDASRFTTYRDSFKWPRGRPAPSPRLSQQSGDARAAGDRPAAGGGAKVSVAAASDHRDRVSTVQQATLSSSAKTVSRSSEVRLPGNNHHSRGADLSLTHHSPTADAPARDTLFKRSDSSPEKDATNEGQSFVSTSRKSSDASNDDSASSKPASEKGPKGTNGKAALANGPAGSGGVDVDSGLRTPGRRRAYQLQSSNGGSPFAYGSDSVSWV